MSSSPRFLFFESLDELAVAMARDIASILNDAIATRGVARLVLAGGSTPEPIHARLAEETVAWPSVHFYWGDERCVPVHHPHSNYGMAQRTLLDRIGAAASNVHRIFGELAPTEAAQRYEDLLRSMAGQTNDTVLAFDCVLLGMGTDGHTASLFPGDRALGEKRRWVVAVENERASPAVARITMTLPLLNAARCALFAASGPAKLALAERIEADLPQAQAYPAARVRPAGALIWYLARA